MTSNWGDLIDAIASRKPEVRTVPPNVKYEDLWDHQQRIQKLEAEVEYLRTLLQEILIRLDNKEN